MSEKFIDMIAPLEASIQKSESELAEMKKRLRILKERRVTECAHEFSPPYNGFEHEGGTCIHCGINEVYYAHMKCTQLML